MRLTKTINTYFLQKKYKTHLHILQDFLFEFESLKCSKLLI